MNPKKIFADASFLIAYYYGNEKKHDIAVEIFDILIDKNIISEISNLHLTKFIVAETLHYVQPVFPDSNALKKCYEELKHLNYHSVDENIMNNAFYNKLLVFCNHKTKKPKDGMGIVDAISLEIMEMNKITYILTFDGHFENIPFCTKISSPQDIEYSIN